jgi:hypothetical protein
MKKAYLIAFIILFCTIGKSFGQKLEENKTDEFTNKPVKRTSWETFVSSSTANTHFRFSHVGDIETFDFKIMMNKVFSIDKDQTIIFKLDNGEVVTIENVDYVITCEGCGAVGLAGSEAEGIQTSYLLTSDQIAKLKAHKVLKVRITTTDGYFDEDVKDKNAAKIIAALNLL